MIFIWIKFLLSALVVIFAGIRLTRSAQLISKRIGLGVIWGGLILLPLITSLPELVTSWRAATIDSPDLAAGNIFGSNLLNLAIIALIDLAHGRGALLAKLRINHVITASFGLILAGIAGLAILSPFNVSIFWVGLDTLFIFVLYITVSVVISYNERNSVRIEAAETEGKEKNETPSPDKLYPAILTFILAGVLIIIAGINLTDSAEVIAVETGLGRTFVGTLLLAVSTSLPEVVTTLTAVRMGLLDMAVANIFGANLMNIVILFFTDLFYIKAPVTSVISEGHLITVFFVIIVTSIAIFGLVYRTSRQIGGIGYDSAFILAGYILSFVFLYLTNASL